MKLNTLLLSATGALALFTLGCERRVVVVETAPTPASDPVARTETLETSRLGAAVDAFERTPTSENRAAAKKAFAELDGEIAELEEDVAKRTGSEREEAAIKLRNLQAYRTAQTTRFTAAEGKAPAVPPSEPDARTGAEKLENAAERIGDKLEDAARKAGDAIDDAGR